MDIAVSNILVNFEKRCIQCLDKSLLWLTDEDLGDNSNHFHFESLKFSFIGVLQNAFSQRKKYWNYHNISQSLSSEWPCGHPSLLYSIFAVGDTLKCYFKKCMIMVTLFSTLNVQRLCWICIDTDKREWFIFLSFQFSNAENLYLNSINVTNNF